MSRYNLFSDTIKKTKEKIFEKLPMTFKEIFIKIKMYRGRF
jgi:hypothetical protein